MYSHKPTLTAPKFFCIGQALWIEDTQLFFIKKALANVSHGRTSLVVAHRLSTIVNSNKIVVVDNGRIIEMGTHLQLIENEGLYTKLYKQELDKK